MAEDARTVVFICVSV